MSQPQKSFGPYLPKLVIGAILAVGGYWFSVNVHPEFLNKIHDQGIPLDLGITIAVIGVFLILFPVINFFYVTPLQEAIGTRNNDLERTFSEAEDLRNEMQTMRTDYERRLAETEASAREQIQNQIKEAQNLRQSLMSEAADKADELVRKAQQEIEQERDRLINDIRVHVVDLTLQATEKVIGENMDSAKNRKLVADFIENLEVAK